MKRSRLPRRRDARIFRQTAKSGRAVNYSVNVPVGGIRF